MLLKMWLNWPFWSHYMRFALWIWENMFNKLRISSSRPACITPPPPRLAVTWSAGRPQTWQLVLDVAHFSAGTSTGLMSSITQLTFDFVAFLEEIFTSLLWLLFVVSHLNMMLLACEWVLYLCPLSRRRPLRVTQDVFVYTAKSMWPYVAQATYECGLRSDLYASWVHSHVYLELSTMCDQISKDAC